jgi:hypothetical protein
MSTDFGGFNRSMQRNERRMSGGSVANETETPDLLQRKPEGVDVGTLAQTGGIQACTTPAIQAGAHACRARGARLNAVARRLNERPRKTLDYETPAERFHRTIASTG